MIRTETHRIIFSTAQPATAARLTAEGRIEDPCRSPCGRCARLNGGYHQGLTREGAGEDHTSSRPRQMDK